eukprot:GHVT01068591.1.p1 GENE.GHVT01068591.1~~GHVT01068591.1.p1  ORF type:complete len:303 (-),score=52.09 GHVT01068591.1:170-1078(-)
MFGELLFSWLACFESTRAVDSSEVDAATFSQKDSGLLLLSQSGETLDTVRACQVAELQGVRRFSVVNSVGSMLARLTNCGVYLNAGREVAVASTKAFTSQVVVQALIASWFNQGRTAKYPDRAKTLLDALHRLPVYAGITLASCGPECSAVAQRLASASSLFVLGKGFSLPVALEGALKIKEISYLHAEAFSSGALKHGPFALIDPEQKTPVVLIILKDQHATLNLNSAQQVKARGAFLICITDEPSMVAGLADATLCIPSLGPLTALLAAIPLQLLAYHIGIAKGVDPDKPRGLAKTVTVL